MGFTGGPGEEKGWQYQILRSLPEIKRTDQQGLVSLPRVDTTLDALSLSRSFSTLDLKSGY